MTAFTDAKIIRAGTSASSPEREFIVRADAAPVVERSFLVKLGRFSFSALVSFIDLESSTIDAGRLALSELEVLSFLLEARIQRSLNLQSSVVEITSSTTNIKDLNIRAITSEVWVESSRSDLRFLQAGFFPNQLPSNRDFTPATYAVTKTMTMANRAARQLMCSRPSGAMLSLEFSNISDNQAENILSAFNQNYGTLYGFNLPESVCQGAGSDLNTYLKLGGSSLLWFFSEPPNVTTTSNNRCTVQISLKARLVVR